MAVLTLVQTQKLAKKWRLVVSGSAYGNEVLNSRRGKSTANSLADELTGLFSSADIPENALEASAARTLHYAAQVDTISGVPKCAKSIRPSCRPDVRSAGMSTADGGLRGKKISGTAAIVSPW